MAGEWIPIRVDLFDCPQVVRILSEICPDCVRDPSERVRRTSEVVGALVRMWSLFDRYTDNGELRGYSETLLDQVVGIDGFASAAVSVGWLEVLPNGLKMPEFSKYLSTSAKTRMKDAQRKRAERAASASCPENVRIRSDKNRTTEEYNTEEKSKEKELNTSCSESQATSKPDQPLANFEFSVVGQPEPWRPTQEFVERLQATYETIDVEYQLRAASLWLDANRTKRKTAVGMNRFLVSWMNRATDNPRAPKKRQPMQPGEIEF